MSFVSFEWTQDNNCSFTGLATLRNRVVDAA